jgi:CRP-like cAMP-binding protein
LEPIDALRRLSFLKGLPDEVLRGIARSGSIRRLQKGETLFMEHQRCLGLVVVLTGAVRVYSLDRRGREMTLDRQEPGESVMELPLFDGGNYPAGAVAAEDDTTAFILARPTFQSLMAEHPDIAEHAVRALAVRMRRLLNMLEAQALHTVQARLALYVVRTAAGRTVFRLEETNEAIGSSIGTVREVVSRTLRALKESGAIDLHGRSITIVDAGLLSRMAER